MKLISKDTPTSEVLQLAIDLALERGEVVTIHLVSDQPPRMGAYLMVPDVRKAIVQPIETHAEKKPVSRSVIPEYTPAVPLGVYMESYDANGNALWSDGIKRTRL